MSAYWKRFSILAFLGLAVSAYLLFHHTEVARGFQQGKSFCTISSTVDCEAVAKSAFAEFLGVPIAGWAIVYYLVLLVLVAILERRKDGDDNSAANVLLFYTALSLIPSFGLLAVSHFVIGKYCLMCLVLDLANVLLFTVALRCPARKDSLFAALSSGLGETFRIAFSSRGVLLWAVGAIGLVTVYLVPEALVRHYFVPRHKKFNEIEFLAPLLTEWRRAPETSVSFNRNGSAADRDYTIGDPNAPVTIVEFSDFQCPFCQKTAEILKPFILTRPKDFQFVFKNYPLDQSCNRLIKTAKHEYACKAAIMARCAGAQSEDKFWKMHDSLMDLPLFTLAAMDSLITNLGLLPGPFEACMNEPSVSAKIREDVEEGVRVKVQATPTLVINNKKVLVAPEYLPGLLSIIFEEVTRGRPAS